MASRVAQLLVLAVLLQTTAAGNMARLFALLGDILYALATNDNSCCSCIQWRCCKALNPHL
jgi:hypothetical protein